MMRRKFSQEDKGRLIYEASGFEPADKRDQRIKERRKLLNTLFDAAEEVDVDLTSFIKAIMTMKIDRLKKLVSIKSGEKRKAAIRGAVMEICPDATSFDVWVNAIT